MPTPIEQNNTDLIEILNTVNSINTEVNSQSSLISQITTALEGKTASSINITLNNLTVTDDGNGHVTIS